MTADCGKLGKARLVSRIVSIRTVREYSPVSVCHLNVITNGLLSIAGEIEGWFNYFDYDSSLKYDSAKIDMDIKKYGLYVYDDFKDYIRKEIFDMLPIPYLKVSVAKGLTTKEKNNRGNEEIPQLHVMRSVRSTIFLFSRIIYLLGSDKSATITTIVYRFCLLHSHVSNVVDLFLPHCASYW